METSFNDEKKSAHEHHRVKDRLQLADPLPQLFIFGAKGLQLIAKLSVLLPDEGKRLQLPLIPQTLGASELLQLLVGVPELTLKLQRRTLVFLILAAVELPQLLQDKKKRADLFLETLLVKEKARRSFLLDTQPLFSHRGLQLQPVLPHSSQLRLVPLQLGLNGK
ncbi:hypothetical protein EYF80_029588 [Liparis tanakae]|uniref:Uncharacterized protein n=1 Tax=Liparis tanakae TaxID=230148 RepID=A0A4Z2H4E1_9TELE|nr:hypothetical protein EYF80_029588 [Liparis tanakae]